MGENFSQVGERAERENLHGVRRIQQTLQEKIRRAALLHGTRRFRQCDARQFISRLAPRRGKFVIARQRSFAPRKNGNVRVPAKRE